jgi:NCS1 family nucleobase:cation symporter-1
MGMNTIDWISIILSIIFQGFLFSSGMNFNKKIIVFSAIFVYVGIFIFFFSVLLSDVQFTFQAFLNNLNYSNLLSVKNIGPIITVAGTIFAYFSIIILSYGDFSRYVKNEKELKKGNLSLILNLIIFSFLALFIVTGTDAFLKQDPENLSRIFTNPTDIIGKLDNLLVTNLALIIIIIASISTNLIANFIPSQYALINFMPSSLTTKSSSFIIMILGFIIGVFWLTYLSQIGILSLIDTLIAFFGPLFGIMISDYYFINKGNLNNKDIYTLENTGTYYYTGGWHLKGFYSLLIGFIFSASTIWNSNLMFLQSYSWIIGAFVASVVYYLLAKK